MIEYYKRCGGPSTRSSLLYSLATTNDGKMYGLFIGSDGYNFCDYSMLASTAFKLDCLMNKVNKNTQTSKWEI